MSLRSQGISPITNEEHIKTISQLYATFSKPQAGFSQRQKVTPAKIANHQKLLDAHAAPLYTAEQVEVVLQKFRSDTESPLQKINSPLQNQEFEQSRNTPVRKEVADAESLANSNGALSPLIKVWCESAQANFNIRSGPTPSLSEIIKQLRQRCNLQPTSTHEYGLFYATDKMSESMVGVCSDEDLADAMRDAQHWVFRPIILTPAQERVIDTMAPVSATVSRKLFSTPGGPEQDELMQVNRAQKRHAYERALEKEIQEAVVKSLLQHDQTIGKQHTTPVKTVLAAVQVTQSLNKLWAKIEGAVGNDHVSMLQRLHWFLEAIVANLDVVVKTRWTAQRQPGAREVESYHSWPDARSRLFSLMAENFHKTPGELVRELPNILVLPGGYASRNDVCAAIDKVRLEAHEYATLRMATDSATIKEVDCEANNFLLSILSPEAHDEMAAYLERKHRDAADSFYKEHLQPPVSAYPPILVREAVEARSGRRGPWVIDFIFGGRAGTDRNSSRNYSGIQANLHATMALGGGREKLSITAETDSKTRKLTRNQQQHVFPYYLRSETDKSKREQLDAEFLALTLADLQCRQCQARGHTAEVCPKFFKLDAKLIERNEKSFYYMLRPSERILSLRKSKAATIMMVSEATAGAASHPDMATVLERLSALEQRNQELEQQLNARAGAE
jgi:hypothetical protein